VAPHVEARYRELEAALGETANRDLYRCLSHLIEAVPAVVPAVGRERGQPGGEAPSSELSLRRRSAPQ
jgi:hypothetical protein